MTAAPFPAALRALLLLWLFLALAAGKVQLLAAQPPLVAQLLIPALAFALLLTRRIASVQAWLKTSNPRTLVLPHVLRLAGIYLLMQASAGILPRAYYQAGLGSLVTGSLALILCLLPLTPARRHSAFTVWNVVGLMDLALLLLAGFSLALAQPAALAPFHTLPLSLIPTFFAPLYLAIHLHLLRQPAPLDAPASTP